MVEDLEDLDMSDDGILGDDAGGAEVDMDQAYDSDLEDNGKRVSSLSFVRLLTGLQTKSLSETRTNWKQKAIPRCKSSKIQS